MLSCTTSLVPSENESTLKEKNLLPMGANSFLLEQTPFQILGSQNWLSISCPLWKYAWSFLKTKIKQFKIMFVFWCNMVLAFIGINPCPAEPGYTLPLQTVEIQISWLLKKPTDLDLHCLPFSMWIHSNNPDQVIRLAEN